MAKNFHNGTDIIAKQDTIFLGEEILEFFMAPTGGEKKHTLVSWRGRFQPLNLERKVWVIEKFSVQKYIRNGHFSSRDKIFVDQLNLKWDCSHCCSQTVLSGPTVALQCRWSGETAVIRRQEMHEVWRHPTALGHGHEDQHHSQVLIVFFALHDYL